MQAASLRSYSPNCLTNPPKSFPSLHPPLPSSPFPIEKKRQPIDSLEPCARIAGRFALPSELATKSSGSPKTFWWYESMARPSPSVPDRNGRVVENVVGSLTCRDSHRIRGIPQRPTYQQASSEPLEDSTRRQPIRKGLQEPAGPRRLTAPQVYLLTQ
jgi:hypothetical protein